ncbi:hypothetical protein C8039_18975 [Halogeometricum sp. wsp3]|nr:hypothetical protein C8039_18975 [Halogeometricum sp. wsp3]
MPQQWWCSRDSLTEVSLRPHSGLRASLLLNEDKATEYENITFLPIPMVQSRAPQQGNWLLGINSHAEAATKAGGKVIQSFVSKKARNVRRYRWRPVPSRYV